MVNRQVPLMNLNLHVQSKQVPVPGSQLLVKSLKNLHLVAVNYKYSSYHKTLIISDCKSSCLVQIPKSCFENMSEFFHRNIYRNTACVFSCKSFAYSKTLIAVTLKYFLLCSFPDMKLQISIKTQCEQNMNINLVYFLALIYQNHLLKNLLYFPYKCNHYSQPKVAERNGSISVKLALYGKNYR